MSDAMPSSMWSSSIVSTPAIPALWCRTARKSIIAEGSDLHCVRMAAISSLEYRRCSRHKQSVKPVLRIGIIGMTLVYRNRRAHG